MSGHTAIPDRIERQLVHPHAAFDPAALMAQAAGFADRSRVEVFAWDYELLAQIRKRSDEGTLFGGACAALHLAPGEQRLSVDVDIYWPPEKLAEWEAVITDIRTNLGDSVYFRFDTDDDLLLPHTKMKLLRYYAHCPSTTGHTVLWGDNKSQNGVTIKLEVAMFTPVSRELIAATQVPPFVRTGPYQALPLIHSVATKLLAVAGGEGGAPAGRADAYAKHVYDLWRLQARLTSVGDVQRVGEAMAEWLRRENVVRRGRTKPTPAGCALGIRDTIQLMSRSQYRDALTTFGTAFLPAGNRPDADQWPSVSGLVAYLGLATAGLVPADEFLAVRDLLPRLAIAHIPTPAARKALERGLSEVLGEGDRFARLRHGDDLPDALFCAVALGGRLDEAIKICDSVLGGDWRQ